MLQLSTITLCKSARHATTMTYFERQFAAPVYDACTAILYGLSRINILKVRFWVGGGGHKKEYAVYARENDDNSGRPLTDSHWSIKMKTMW